MRVDPVGRALQIVLKRVPFSMRELARRSGVSHETLRKARDGEIRLSEEVACRIAQTLREASVELNELANLMEKAIKKRAKH